MSVSNTVLPAQEGSSFGPTDLTLTPDIFI